MLWYDEWEIIMLYIGNIKKVQNRVNTLHQNFEQDIKHQQQQ